MIKTKAILGLKLVLRCLDLRLIFSQTLEKVMALSREASGRACGCICFSNELWNYAKFQNSLCEKVDFDFVESLDFGIYSTFLFWGVSMVEMWKIMQNNSEGDLNFKVFYV